MGIIYFKMTAKDTFLLFFFLFILAFGCQHKIQITPPTANKTAMYYYSAALAAFERNEVPAAISKIDSALIVRPNFALFYFTRGKFLEEAKLWDAATDSYEKSLQIKSHYPEAWQRLQFLYRRAGQFKKAVPVLNNLLEQYPDSIKYEVFLAESYLMDGKAPLALARARALRNRGYSGKNLQRICGIAKYRIGDLSGALADLEPLLNDGLQDYLAFKTAGLAQYQSGRVEAGIEYLNKALALNGLDSEIYLYRSRYFELRQKFRAALEQIKKAEQLDSMRADVQIQFARLALLQQDTLSARERLHNFIQRSTNCWECFKYLGIIAESAGQKGKALEYYRKYLKNSMHRDADVEQRIKNLGSK